MGIRHEQIRVADTGTCPFSLSTSRIAFSVLGVLPLTKLGGKAVVTRRGPPNFHVALNCGTMLIRYYEDPVR